MSSSMCKTILLIEPSNAYAEILYKTAQLNDKFLRQKPVSQRSTIATLPLSFIESANRSREQTPLVVDEPEMVWAITFNHVPKSGRRWIFGGDAATCDFLLSKDNSKDTGVSGQHFEIYFNDKSRTLFIKNLSARNVIYTSTGGRIDRFFGPRELASQQPTTIHAGLVKLQFICPVRDEFEHRDFLRNLEDFLSYDGIATPTNKHVAIDGAAPVDKTTVDSSPEETPLIYDPKNMRIFQDIDRGGFGTVSRAIHCHTGQPYAVKVVRKRFRDKSDEEWRTKKIRAEKAVVGKLKHDNIVSFYAAVESEQALTLVMEFCSGGNLRTQAVQQHFSQVEVMTVAQQQCSALEYLHDKGITHRDIKPDNILVFVRTPLLTKLADFGECSHKDTMMTYAGNEAYQAPEMSDLRINQTVTSKVDIYSLGLVLIGLLKPGVAIGALYELPQRARGSLAELCGWMVEDFAMMRVSAEECSSLLQKAEPPYWIDEDVPEQTDTQSSQLATRKSRSSGQRVLRNRSVQTR